MADQLTTRSGLRIAILGAECTGKSVLTRQLSHALVQADPGSATSVSEWLRIWCHLEQRTPRQEEQRPIAEMQEWLIDTQASRFKLVVCDTTALMTAVYSVIYFDDHRLLNWAVERQRRCALTILTAPDLPWQPDGFMRDGQAVRLRTDALLRELMTQYSLPWVYVRGDGPQRWQQALQAVQAVRAARAPIDVRKQPAARGECGHDAPDD